MASYSTMRPSVLASLSFPPSPSSCCTNVEPCGANVAFSKLSERGAHHTCTSHHHLPTSARSATSMPFSVACVREARGGAGVGVGPATSVYRKRWLKTTDHYLVTEARRSAGDAAVSPSPPIRKQVADSHSASLRRSVCGSSPLHALDCDCDRTRTRTLMLPSTSLRVCRGHLPPMATGRSAARPWEVDVEGMSCQRETLVPSPEWESVHHRRVARRRTQLKATTGRGERGALQGGEEEEDKVDKSKGDGGHAERTEGSGAGASKDTKGAGLSWISPDWLTSLVQGGMGTLRGPDQSGIPVANAKLDDVRDLLGGALFLPLFKWMLESGSVYRLAAGPRNFVVIGDPQAAKHVLRNYGKYKKGLVSEVAEFLFGSGFAIAEGEIWTVRRRAVAPSLHKEYLETMVDRVFGACVDRLVQKLDQAALERRAVDVESCFSQLTLDVIGKAVFNFDFDSLQRDSPVIQAVYTALKETESRSTDILPYWQIPLLCQLVPRQRKAAAAVALIRATVEELIAKCKAMVDKEEQEQGQVNNVDNDYVNESDPSVLRFLLQSREEVSSQQLRDDLLSMLVAGHETTGSVLTWTVYLLVKNPAAMAKVKEELDNVLAGRRKPTLEDTKSLKYLIRCINESMRLYPHPPILIRRANEPDVLPGGYRVGAGQDIMISVYNIHHSPQVWDKPEEFIPERFDLDGPVPNETNTDFRYIPFSGGPRKCVGDQFAMLEVIVSLAIIFQNFDFELVPNQTIGMTTGATIHTSTGLYMTMKRRERAAACAASEFVLV
ncbi:hypothetical protein CBR_g4469 [Chara braunii]|uniref:Cytochrome P450 n=1 Tax=Chara braunii TaxID=69332 RepID=A0A388KHV2_CHABU|nr:hypothetical protein CBR_g4469 [Chara braunii]|eukprot:GBG69640.1 hypothetical protein CBR_g4469 [Chara braunii]